MKQCYPSIPLFPAFFTLIFFLPASLAAQCTCADGTPALTEVQVVNTTFPSNSTKTITVPQFSPSKGTLVCVNAKVFLTSILRMNMENDEAFLVDKYLIHYDRYDSLMGPGITPPVSGNFKKDYGPFSLGANDGAYGVGPDHVFIGPDTVYDKKIYEATTANVAGYLGAGTINFLYKSIVPTYATGSDLYSLSVSAQNRMEFRMTYSYCNDDVLPMSIVNFQATLLDKDDVSLDWTILNENKINTYEIELSHDGTTFTGIGAPSHKSADGTSAKYHHQHHLDQPLNGKLYFRIRQTSGKTISHSEVRTVHTESGKVSHLRILPNPVIRDVRLEFEAPADGEYIIELVNQMGSVVDTRRLRISNSSALSFVLNDPPPPGLYYVRARKAGTKTLHSGKMIIQN